jgi:hypothetical protein
MKKFLSIIICIAVSGFAFKFFSGFITSATNPVAVSTDTSASELPQQIAAHPVKPNPLRNMFGINCYEWNFESNPLNPNDPTHVYAPKLNAIKTFTAIRHYMDWSKIENTQGNYTFNPTHNGGWNYDAIYQACKENNILVLACLKTIPDWLRDTYPTNLRNNENVPAPYGLDRQAPASYILQAKAGFQFAARYGFNKKVDPGLVHVDQKQRWTGDPVNQPNIGMGLVHYIECDNERDKWWRGKQAQQNGTEYAANMSAFYDGDKGKLGKGVGVKNADPTMQVVMTGLSSADPKFVEDMITWCKMHRGYKPDGSIDLCFDVINYHFSANDHAKQYHDQATTGIAPELSEGARVADAFVAISNRLKQHPPVWVTETCYDINPASPQGAKQVADRAPIETQADWLLRAVLQFNRHGINRVFFYQLFDDNNSAVQYSTSGLIDEKTLKRRPSGDFVYQTDKLMGNYLYKSTISQNPLVDVYQLGDKKMYVLVVPDQKGRTAHFTLDMGSAKSVIVHTLKAGADATDATTEPTVNGKFDMVASETPVFVEAVP